ncbi:zinc finger BED domain-containing protein RICESLEEPER 2-like [Nicotiana tabacum]|uniref:Zinc finger BED domain-containing protein RICESLEEPER 2-like n=1 Tax=Nicotiana tabacum TaxID=4097 RepID=A0AC58UIG2_TOBAC
MVVTAHWIYDQWNIQTKILNFPTPNYKGETIAKGIEACLFDWGIENASANDAAIKHLKVRIDDWKGVILGNEFLHVRCNAHILNLIVKDGLDEQIEPISSVRNMVKYIRSSLSRFSSFKSLVEKAKIDTHGSLYATSNSFFHEFFNLQNDIIKYTKSDDLILIYMAGRMKSKLEKYWGKFEDMNMLLLVAVVLNPRFKMK